MAEQRQQHQDFRPGQQHLAHLQQDSAQHLSAPAADGTVQTLDQLTQLLHGAQHPWPPVRK